MLGNGYRVGVAFRDVPYLPGVRLTARVKRGGEWAERTVTARGWRAGVAEEVDFADAGGADVKPTEFEVVVEASHAGLTHTRRLGWQND